MYQMHKYKNTTTKYTNTQVQHTKKCQKDPTYGIFLKRKLFKDIKNYNPMCQTHKYTNAQVQHMTKCQKDPTCGIFVKRELFKDIKNYIPMSQTHKHKNINKKYTNTAHDKVPEKPNIYF